MKIDKNNIDVEVEIPKLIIDEVVFREKTKAAIEIENYIYNNCIRLVDVSGEISEAYFLIIGKKESGFTRCYMLYYYEDLLRIERDCKEYIDIINEDTSLSNIEENFIKIKIHNCL